MRAEDVDEIAQQRFRWHEPPTFGYERRNWERYRASGGRVGMLIVLDKAPPFWSRGWRGCDRCGGDVHQPGPMEFFEERSADGEIRRGWRCRNVIAGERRRR